MINVKIAKYRPHGVFVFFNFFHMYNSAKISYSYDN